MEKRNEILKILSSKLREIATRMQIDFEELQGMRLRINGPFIVLMNAKEYFVSEEGRLVGQAEDAYIVKAGFLCLEDSVSCFLSSMAPFLRR